MVEARSRLNEGLSTSGPDSLENGGYEEQSTVNAPEVVGTGYSDIDDCTSLDEEVQHKRTPFGDIQPLRGTGSLLAQNSGCVVLTYGQPQYFGWIHIPHATRNLHQSIDLSFMKRDYLYVVEA